MEIVAGIDGGGTVTTLRIANVGGEFENVYKFGPFNINSIGEEAFSKLIDEIYEKIQESGECKAICFGAAGISNPAVKSVIKAKGEALFPDCKFILKGDHEIALYGAMNGEPGAILISGTGSIALGIDGEGRTIRIGGWGHLIDDLGSGYAIGRDGLSCVVKSYDGRICNSTLAESLFRALKVNSINEMISVVYSNDKSLIASLSKVVEQAASLGDSVALGVINKAANDLFDIVSTMYSRLGLTEIDLVLMGGMLNKDTVLKQKLLTKIRAELPNVNIVQPKCDAVTGAVMLALKEIGA